MRHALHLLERDVAHAIAHDLCGGACDCQHEGGGAPAFVTVTLYSEGSMMSETTFEPGQTIYASAEVDNKGGTSLPDSGTWSTSAGTVSPDPSNPLRATVVGAPDGEVVVTYTASNGVVGQVSGTVSDDTPATVTVTLSSTPPADITPASA